MLYVFRRKEMCKRVEYETKITVQIETLNSYVKMIIPIFIIYLATSFL